MNARICRLSVVVEASSIGPRGQVSRTNYELFFGALVRIDEPAGLLRMSAGVHQQPLKGGGNLHLRQLAEVFLAEQLPEHHPGALAPRVRAAIEQALGTAPVTIATVAAMFVGTSAHPSKAPGQGSGSVMYQWPVGAIHTRTPGHGCSRLHRGSCLRR